MPRTREDPDLLEAIELVANGVAPRLAWEQCNKPNGESGIQNVRKARVVFDASGAAGRRAEEQKDAK